MSVLQLGLGLAVPCLGLATVVGTQAALSRLMHQLHSPSAWPGDGCHSIDLKLRVLWGRKNPFPGVGRGEGCCLPCPWTLWAGVCHSTTATLRRGLCWAQLCPVSSQIVNCLVQPEV